MRVPTLTDWFFLLRLRPPHSRLVGKVQPRVTTFSQCVIVIVIAWRIWDFRTTFCSFPLRWKNYVKCSVSSNPVLKLYVWELTPTKQRFSPSRTNKRQKRSRSATSVSRSCQKETVRDILDRKSRSRRQETEEIKNRLKAAWAAFPQNSARINIERLPDFAHRLRLFKMVNTPTIDIRKWNVDIITETRKNHQDHAPKDASPYCTNE